MLVQQPTKTIADMLTPERIPPVLEKPVEIPLVDQMKALPVLKGPLVGNELFAFLRDGVPAVAAVQAIIERAAEKAGSGGAGRRLLNRIFDDRTSVFMRDLLEAADLAAAQAVLGIVDPTAEIQAAVAALVDSSPAALDTLNELAAALGDDANFATTVTSALGARVSIVADRTALAALATTNTTAFLREAGREGLFKWDSSDLSAEVVIDTAQGVLVPPTGQDGSTGAWRRIFNDRLVVTPEMFGAPADDSGDDAPAFTAMAATIGSLKGAIPHLTPGKTYRLSSQVTWDCDLDLYGNDAIVKQNYAAGEQIVFGGSVTRRERIFWYHVHFAVGPNNPNRHIFESRWVRILTLVGCSCSGNYAVGKLGRIADTDAKPTTFVTLDDCYFTLRAVAGGDHIDMFDALNINGGFHQRGGEMEADIASVNDPAFLKVADNIQTRLDHVSWSAGALVKQFGYVLRAENKRVVNIETGTDCRFDNTRTAAFRIFADGAGSSANGWGSLRILGTFGGVKAGKIVELFAEITSGLAEFSDTMIGPILATGASGSTFDHLIHIKASSAAVINSLYIGEMLLNGFAASGAGKHVVFLEGSAANGILDFHIDGIHHRGSGGTAYVDVVKIESPNVFGTLGDRISSNHYSGLLRNWAQFDFSPRCLHSGGRALAAGTEGNDTTPVTTETYICEIYIPRLTRLTGIAINHGSATEGNVKLGLANSAGIVVASTASTDISGDTVNTLRRIAFSSVYDAKPGAYYILQQCDSTSHRFRSHPFGNFGASKKTSETYGTFTAITPPTTFTANLGPIASLY